MYQTLLLVGNLGKEPDKRFTPAGNPVTTLNLATNRRYYGPDGQPIRETTWFKVTVWGKQAESCARFLHKGSRVLVEGRLTPDPTTGGPRIRKKDGKSFSSFEVTASSVRFLSVNEEAENQESSQKEENLSDSVNEEIPF